jgi:hypothetical protein
MMICRANAEEVPMDVPRLTAQCERPIEGGRWEIAQFRSLPRLPRSLCEVHATSADRHPFSLHRLDQFGLS